MKRIALSIILLCCLVGSTVVALPRYQKREVMITMRDGVRLYTSIFEPVDSVPCPEGHPIMMSRTCYSCAPYGTEGERIERQLQRPGDSVYMAAGYIFVKQDVRGKNMSEGQFVDIRPFVEGKRTPKFRKDGTVIVNRKAPIDEASDTYETCEWLIHNTNSNGCIGVKGISYPGFYSTMAALSGHPALKAVSPQAPVTDWWRGDDAHHNGAFAVADMYSFQYWFEYMMRHEAYTDTTYARNLKSPIGLADKDIYTAYLEQGALSNISKLMGDSVVGWNDVVNHPDLDAFWENGNVSAGHCHDVKPAIMVIGGLFDAEDCYGAFQTYRAIRDQSPATSLRLVEGPWAHGLWSRGQTEQFGAITFGPEITSEWYQENIETPFFNYYLMGQGEKPAEGVTIFDTGSHQWHQYTHADWKQQEIAPAYPMDIVAADAKPISYVSDPQHPVPYTSDPSMRRTLTYMLDDQRFATSRPDVVSVCSPELTEELAVSGPVDVQLKVSLSSTDADFVVKIIDVFPGSQPGARRQRSRNSDRYQLEGYQMLVRWEIMRGKYRNTAGVKDVRELEGQTIAPQPFVPGEVTEVNFRLNDLQHTFLPGHKIMIQVQSSMFPLFDRNPQQFCDIYHCSEEDYIPCTVTLHPGSRVMLPVK